MGAVRVQLTVQPISDWESADVERMYQVLVADVRRLSDMPDVEPERSVRLPTAQAHAAMFGEELVRRGLI